MTDRDVTPPIHRSSVFQFKTLDDLTEAIDRGDYVYSRWSNPTVRAVERMVMELEGAEDSLAFSFGMAAISTTLLTLLRSGERLAVLRDVYGGTVELVRDLFPRWGIEAEWFSADDPMRQLRKVGNGCRLIYVESPTNPLLRVLDLRELADEAHRRGGELVVDNTFATPVNQSPIALGAGLAIHSASKFLGGHSDLIGGFVAGSTELIERIKCTRSLLGGTMDPQTAFLCWRGIKTLSVRVVQQNENAQRVAQFLEGRPEVEKVWYPGMKTHPDYELARKQMRGSGCVVTFDLKTAVEGVRDFLKCLKIIRLAPSLGGCDSLITHPATTSHAAMPEVERSAVGVTDSLLRLSVGLESADRLIEDLSEALLCISKN